mgnify:FL=1
MSVIIETKDLDIKDISYHRNGVGGYPFYVIYFYDKEKQRNFIATIFFEYDDDGQRKLGFNPRVAVIDPALASKGNIKFGENSWRGDCYSYALAEAIEEKEKCDEC